MKTRTRLGSAKTIWLILYCKVTLQIVFEALIECLKSLFCLPTKIRSPFTTTVLTGVSTLG